MRLRGARLARTGREISIHIRPSVPRRTRPSVPK